MNYMRHPKTFKGTIVKAFVAGIAISVSATAAVPVGTDLDRNLEEIDRRKARRVTFDECLRYIGVSAESSLLDTDFEYKNYRRVLSVAHGTPLMEGKKTIPTPQSFLGDFWHYMCACPPVFNMYTSTYKISAHRRSSRGKSS